MLPDTQEYCDDTEKQHLYDMADWIVSKKDSLKIAAVVFMGDHVLSSNDASWAIVDYLIDAMDGANIPIMGVPGNHDYDTLSTRVLTHFNLRYAPSLYTAKSWWNGGFYEAGKGENFYYLFSSGGHDYVVIGMEYGPRAAVVAWADALLTTYATRAAIIITHVYMDTDGTREGTGDTYNPHSDTGIKDDCHDGDELWTELVSQHSNIVQVWSGHQTGFIYRQDVGADGKVVRQILCAHGNTDSHLGVAQYYRKNNLVRMTRYLPSNGTMPLDWEMDIQ
jgi:hypothetical protein